MSREQASVEAVAQHTRLPADVVRVFAWLDPRALGAALGTVCGLGLALPTFVLVVRGGPNQGFHFWLLVNYLPGYSVTGAGVLVGLLYGGLIGLVAGYVLARTRNAVANAYLHHLWRKAERASLSDLLDHMG